MVGRSIGRVRYFHRFSFIMFTPGTPWTPVGKNGPTGRRTGLDPDGSSPAFRSPTPLARGRRYETPSAADSTNPPSVVDRNDGITLQVASGSVESDQGRRYETPRSADSTTPSSRSTVVDSNDGSTLQVLSGSDESERRRVERSLLALPTRVQDIEDQGIDIDDSPRPDESPDPDRGRGGLREKLDHLVEKYHVDINKNDDENASVQTPSVSSRQAAVPFTSNYVADDEYEDSDEADDADSRTPIDDNGSVDSINIVCSPQPVPIIPTFDDNGRIIEQDGVDDGVHEAGTTTGAQPDGEVYSPDRNKYIDWTVKKI